MAVRIDPGPRRVELGVGDLLARDEPDPFAPGRASSFGRLLAGSRAHAEYALALGGRGPGWESEVVVRGELEVDGWRVLLQGRVDALERRGDGCTVEEVKTVLLSESAFAALDPGRYPAYRLQLQVYLWLLGREAPPAAGAAAQGAAAAAPDGRLVFVNLVGGAQRAFAVAGEDEATERFVVARVRELLAAWRAEEERLAARRALAALLPFPFPERRAGQAEMEGACARAFDQGECLLVTAPPGLGKTAAALSAALGHALREDRRVFFVTARTTQQRIVAATLERMAAPGLTAVVLRAKAKICANEVVVCHPDACAFARDYPAKVAASGARERLLRLPIARPEAVREEGLRAQACPFELQLELAERADVVVGDYNYVFDPWVSLRGALEEGEAKDLVLVIDEAHNLLDRAREYWSPLLDGGRLAALLEEVEGRPGPVYRMLERWLRALLDRLGRIAEEASWTEPLREPVDGSPRWAVERDPSWAEPLRAELEALLVEYLAFRRACGSVVPDDPVIDAAFAFLRFARVLALEGDEFVHLVEPGRAGGARYRILCLDPARQLARRLRSFHAVVAMSATLHPEPYYRDLLGFPPERTSALVLPSPFPRENRRVLVVPTVSTAWRERARWYDAVAAHVRDVVAARPGHWVAFLPSFAYLREIEARVGAAGSELLVQAERMSDPERAEVLERLERPDGRARLLLAVLGGVFAEGVDLPGEALVGVIVVSPGLPLVSLERELLRRRCDELYGSGFEYAYLVPGLGRVVQAAGRLVRSERDRGVVVLLDRRFAEPRYARLLPRDWYEREPRELVVGDAAGEVARFFAGLPPPEPWTLSASRRAGDATATDA